LWEDKGYDVTVGGTKVHVDLPNANKNHKDIWVYYDWVPGYKPLDGFDSRLYQMFNNAPVSNPDIIGGIHPPLVEGKQIRGFGGAVTSLICSGFMSQVKAVNLPAGYSRAFHYAVFADTYKDAHGIFRSGISHSTTGIGGSEFI